MPRINRCIELFEQNQPVYYIAPDDRSYEGGQQMAHTWADYIVYDIEHHPFDMTQLRAFMAGLIAGGPTKSGHRTPAVIVTLPFDGTSPDVVRANSWVIKQVLACGVHGLLLVHAE
jgi:4-hydroxy-2-oxoheptanedioate aldolase